MDYEIYAFPFNLQPPISLALPVCLKSTDRAIFIDQTQPSKAIDSKKKKEVKSYTGRMVYAALIFAISLDGYAVLGTPARETDVNQTGFPK